MADANGSYDAKNAIEIGKRLQEMKYLWFEEPCPWEELSETKKVADALDMKVAFGEQDSSLWLFQWMIDNKVMDVVQPDLNYNGGFIRAAKVARMARKAKMWICPHDTQTGAASVNILQFAATTPNIGPCMEYVSRKPPKKESWYSPNFDIQERRDPGSHRTGHGTGIRSGLLEERDGGKAGVGRRGGLLDPGRSWLWRRDGFAFSGKRALSAP